MLQQQKGQMTIEVILMTVVVVMASVMVAKFFREEEVFGNIVSGPWKRLSGMIQNGVWQAPEDSMILHPNSFARVSSVKGEVVQNE